MEPGAGVVLAVDAVDGVLDEPGVVDPIEPVPLTPEVPVEPMEPVEPEEPIEPEEPVEPIEPGEPVKPLEPEEPVKPLEPVEPDAPEVPVDPALPAAPGVDVLLAVVPEAGKELPPVVEGFCAAPPVVPEAEEGEPLVEPEVEPVLLPGIFLLVSTMMISFIKSTIKHPLSGPEFKASRHAGCNPSVKPEEMALPLVKNKIKHLHARLRFATEHNKEVY